MLKLLLAWQTACMLTMIVLINACISAQIGVRQGVPISCILFVINIDMFVRKLKEAFDEDGFLSCFHVMLVLMDDTVILVVSRQKFIQEFHGLIQIYNEYHGMEIKAERLNLWF